VPVRPESPRTRHPPPASSREARRDSEERYYRTISAYCRRAVCVVEEAIFARMHMSIVIVMTADRCAAQYALARYDAKSHGTYGQPQFPRRPSCTLLQSSITKYWHHLPKKNPLRHSLLFDLRLRLRYSVCRKASKPDVKSLRLRDSL
jgi:hypothetical protein